MDSEIERVDGGAIKPFADPAQRKRDRTILRHLNGPRSEELGRVYDTSRFSRVNPRIAASALSFQSAYGFGTILNMASP
jgi:hypothetical protein